jgi:hypothetical protein
MKIKRIAWTAAGLTVVYLTFFIAYELGQGHHFW